MKRCKTLLDRISSLKEELLSRILSVLPTEEAVRTSTLSRRWRRVYGWVTQLEFHDSSHTHHFDCPQRIPQFITHVDTVLRVCRFTDMTRFSLEAGKAFTYSFDLESAHVDRWISFPLTRTIREIDLCVHVKHPGKLPPQLFSLDKVQVLKIDSNLLIQNPVSFALISVRVLRLKTLVIPDSDFLAGLLSGCPSLLELEVIRCECRKSPVVKISHPFLQRLSLDMPPIKTYKFQHTIVLAEYQRTNVVLDTPNLQYLSYSDSLALRYSAGNLNALVEADIHISGRVDYEETYPESMLSLLRLLAKIHSLTLYDMLFLDCEAFRLKEKLVFLNLKDLKLDINDIRNCFVLLDLLHCSPFLERITIPRGIEKNDELQLIDANIGGRVITELESTAHIPSCLGSHLKTIAYAMYEPSEVDFCLLKYFLRNAAVLQEMEVTCSSVDLIHTEIALKNLPRESANCLIKLHLSSSELEKRIMANVGTWWSNLQAAMLISNVGKRHELAAFEALKELFIQSPTLKKLFPEYLEKFKQQLELAAQAERSPTPAPENTSVRKTVRLDNNAQNDVGSPSLPECY